MNIAVIGLGSMGRRRIRILQKIRKGDQIIGIDSKEERCEATNREFGIDTMSDLSVALDQDIYCAFVCTSPLSHGKIIYQCLQKNVSVFTEINLTDDFYDINLALAKEQGKILYLSSTPLFRGEVGYISKRVQQTKGNLGYIYHVGQYLPDWHPWESYKDFFIGDKRTNGCREILAIEFPWLVRCFGAIKNIEVLAARSTHLKIDYLDNYAILIRHETGHQGVLAIDVVCRKAVRYFEVYGEQLYLTWDGTTEGLKEYDIEKKTECTVNLYEQVEHLDGYNPLIIENAYESEMIDFFKVLEEGKTPEYTFEQDKNILEWIDRIEKHA